MSKLTAAQTEERAEALAKLREMFPIGSTATTVIRHVSRSGMQRAISVLHAGPDGIEDVSWLVARATDFRFNRSHGGLTVNGCGMDMTFHLVYSLSAHLHGNGYLVSVRNV